MSKWDWASSGSGTLSARTVTIAEPSGTNHNLVRIRMASGSNLTIADAHRLVIFISIINLNVKIFYYLTLILIYVSYQNFS